GIREKMSGAIREQEVGTPGVHAPEVHLIASYVRPAWSQTDPRRVRRAKHIARIADVPGTEDDVPRARVIIAGPGKPPAEFQVAARHALANQQRVARAIGD